MALPFLLFGKRITMEVFFYFLASLVAIVLDIVSFAMMVRILLSFFMPGEDNRITVFLALITEPFILPVRFILSRFKAFQSSPIDWSFTIAYFVIIMLRLMLPAI